MIKKPVKKTKAPKVVAKPPKVAPSKAAKTKPQLITLTVPQVQLLLHSVAVAGGATGLAMGHVAGEDFLLLLATFAQCLQPGDDLWLTELATRCGMMPDPVPARTSPPMPDPPTNTSLAFRQPLTWH